MELSKSYPHDIILLLPKKHALSHANGVIERVHPEPRRMGDAQRMLRIDKEALPETVEQSWESN